MKKLFIAALIMLLTIQISNAFEEKTINALAVSTEGHKGVVIKITVTITPGSGKIFVSTPPLVQIDMQSSAQLAALTACDLLGLDFTNYNFYYFIESDVGLVGGPSAGAVMTIATIAALKNLSINEDVYMSGTILPGGFVGPVGDLKYKLEAAAKNGCKVFLVPKGQLTTTATKKIGNVTAIEIVNLKDLARTYKIDIHEVETIEEALYYYTGYKLQIPNASLNLTSYETLFKKMNDKMISDVEELKSLTYSYANKNEKAEELINEAMNLTNKSYYYSSTCRLFLSKVYLRWELYNHTIKDQKSFDGEYENIKFDIDAMKLHLKNEKIGINSFQIIAAAQERVFMAEDSLKKAKELYPKNVSEALYNLAYAKERLETAITWYSLKKYMKDYATLDKKALESRIRFYLSHADSMIVYATYLYGNEVLIKSADNDHDMARKMYDEGFLPGAFAAAVDSLLSASMSIEVYYADINKSVKNYEKMAKIAIKNAEKTTTPVLAAAYYEFAKIQKDNIWKLHYYELSMKIAKLLSSVTKLEEVKASIC